MQNVSLDNYFTGKYFLNDGSPDNLKEWCLKWVLTTGDDRFDCFVRIPCSMQRHVVRTIDLNTVSISSVKP